MASAVSVSAQCDCAGPMPRSCSLLKETRAVFVGSLTAKTPQYRFRVDEKIKGVTGDSFDVEAFPCIGYEYFQVGKRYLVFVDVIRLDDGEHLFAHKCGPTRELKYAQAILQQMRAEKDGKRDASVYGMLQRTLDPYTGIWDEDYIRALPGIAVRLQSKERIFETKTDALGAYAFERLPKGTYQVSADLPPNLEVAQQISKEPAPPLELPRRSCYEHDITALPTGQIAGRVMGLDGAPLITASVELYRADLYQEGQAGVFGYQGDSKPFEFVHLPAGDYILVFNRRDQARSGTSFPRTFYPDAPDLRSAQIIHLKDGQKIVNADIRLRATRSSGKPRPMALGSRVFAAGCPY
jgi:hypothetical protein